MKAHLTALLALSTVYSLVATSARADVRIQSEHLNPADPAWSFKTGPVPSQVEHVWVVFKTHLDIGYTETIERVLEKYRVTMMDDALRVIEDSRKLPPAQRFSWTLAGWPLTHVLGPEQDPARRARIEQAVRAGVLVTAFGQNPDGRGTLLRVWEQAGASGDCTVGLPEALKANSARPVNLRGEALGNPLPVRSGRLRVALQPFAPCSFVLE